MARIDAVWGIDIGNCSLKALRCRLGDAPNSLVGEAFDYIEYPKILTQPDAQPADLIQDALRQFLSRNEIRGTRVGVSVSGQNGLARFIKLPPVESKKIPAIVQYEARQQIPFDLDDVIWDYQRMSGGMEEEGFALETEIGLFAMKRDQVFRAMEPFDARGSIWTSSNSRRWRSTISSPSIRCGICPRSTSTILTTRPPPRLFSRSVPMPRTW